MKTNNPKLLPQKMFNIGDRVHTREATNLPRDYWCLTGTVIDVIWSPSENEWYYRVEFTPGYDVRYARLSMPANCIGY